jgi:hypothetical protein
MEAGPNAARVGVLPSSCQVICTALPEAILVEATGLVILEGCKSGIVDKIVRHGRKRSHGQEEQGQQEKERRERKTLLGSLGEKRVEGKRESERADSENRIGGW